MVYVPYALRKIINNKGIQTSTQNEYEKRLIKSCKIKGILAVDNIILIL
jgi:hypothetical protein